jgi:hypothetical protein
MFPQLPRPSVPSSILPLPRNSSFERTACELPRRSLVNLTVYNTLGQEVATLVHGEEDLGHHEAMFNASGFSSGVYLYRLKAGEYASTKKMVVLK